MTQKKQTGLKSIGILLSYLLLIIGCHFFNWSPIGFFVALYVELVVIVITYIVFRILDKAKNPRKYRKLPDIGNIVTALAGALLLQYVFMIGTLSLFHQVEISEPLKLMDESGGWIAFIAIAAVYLINSLDNRTISQKEYELQQNLFLEILSLSGMNLLGIILLFYLNDFSQILALMILFIIRAAIEIYFKYKTNWT
ncbi:MAG: hypothetical protein ACO2Z9_00280 [Crocinitomicaceae bacterium]